MTAMLIGSRALKFWMPNIKISENADWDVISNRPIQGTEWHDLHFMNNSEFKKFTSDDKVVEYNGEIIRVVNPWGLSIIKRSHLWRNLSFQKHITYYHKHMVNFKRQYYSTEQEKLLQERILMTMQNFPQPHPSLDKTVGEFFDDYVEKKYDHDYLHELVAYYSKPLYTMLQRDSSKAWCEKDLWDKLSPFNKIACVAEETQVIAIERFLVPNDWKYPIRHAYIKALDKVCTTLCSGWFRDWAIDYYPKVFELCDEERFQKIRKELENGKD